MVLVRCVTLRYVKLRYVRYDNIGYGKKPSGTVRSGAVQFGLVQYEVRPGTQYTAPHRTVPHSLLAGVRASGVDSPRQVRRRLYRRRGQSRRIPVAASQLTPRLGVRAGERQVRTLRAPREQGRAQVLRGHRVHQPVSRFRVLFQGDGDRDVVASCHHGQSKAAMRQKARSGQGAETVVKTKAFKKKIEPILYASLLPTQIYYSCSSGTPYHNV